ncbi:hypothetical protein PSHT_13490 [Puccinia striiformis]|uniref:Secreted protein n=1 Tax=Puccinia striiformis TaxID=27350 RepID=A0A2S4UQI1_9BASI|nr:hypothetical protein PSHT_13490 [Puccinia striiformis]
MKIIDFFQPPHITSLILAFVFTSSEALAAATQSRSCNQYFFVGNTPGVSFCRSDHVSYKCRLNSCTMDNKPWASALFKQCDLLDKQRGNVIPGHQLETLIALQYHVEDEGVEVQNKNDARWYRCPQTDFNDHTAAACTSCTVQA